MSIPLQTFFEQEERIPGEGFNIETFNAYVAEKGFQRTSKFLVRMHIPPLMQSDPILSNSMKLIEFYCMAASFPGYTLALHENLRYSHGPAEKKPFGPVFSEISFVFLGDAEGHINKFFNTWLTCMVNKDMRDGVENEFQPKTIKAHGLASEPIDQFEIAYKLDYATTVEIVMFADSGNRSNRAVLLEAYPVRIEDSPLNWGEKANISPVQVTFTFLTWHIDEIVMAQPVAIE